MNEFEIGFERPSLDNPRLFDRYTNRMQVRASEICAGYAIRAEKKEDPGKRRWVIQLEKGWHSGCEIEIEPKRDTPHRAIVSVTQHSKLRRVLTSSAAALYAGASILILLTGWLVIRIGFLFILLFVSFFPYMLLTFGLIRLLETLTGRNEMSPERRRELIEHLRALPLLEQTGPPR